MKQKPSYDDAIAVGVTGDIYSFFLLGVLVENIFFLLTMRMEKNSKSGSGIRHFYAITDSLSPPFSK